MDNAPIYQRVLVKYRPRDGGGGVLIVSAVALRTAAEVDQLVGALYQMAPLLMTPEERSAEYGADADNALDKAQQGTCSSTVEAEPEK